MGRMVREQYGLVPLHAAVRIIISNDDGIYSPGLAALAEVAAEFGDVRIVAPDVEQSSMSQAITSARPLSYRRAKIAGFDAYRVNGTPSDCVGLGVFNWEKVDLVLSGINLGTNLGNAVWHSGTLAAAKQAALLGVRGVAFSMPVSEAEPSFDTVKNWVKKSLDVLIRLPDLRLVNVNIPANPKGMMWTRQSCRQYDGKIVSGADPAGRKLFWYTVVPIEDVEEGTDRWAFRRQIVSMTPLGVDLTDEKQLDTLQRQSPLG